MTDFEVTIENCNSIDTANILVTKGCLNIKYGPNGIGKSTIAKAIVSQARQDGFLAELAPFKLRGKKGSGQPSVSGIDAISSALVFDEEYVNHIRFPARRGSKEQF